MKRRRPHLLLSFSLSPPRRRRPTMAASRPSPDWSTLPRAVLLQVLSHFTTLADFFALRGVCSRWRSRTASPGSGAFVRQSPILICSKVPSGNAVFYDATDTSFYKAWVPPRAWAILDLGANLGFLVAPDPSESTILHNVFTGAVMSVPKSNDFSPRRLILSAPPSAPGCVAVFFAEGGSFFVHGSVAGYPNHGWRAHDVDPRGRQKVHDMVFVGGKLFALVSPRKLLVTIDLMNANKAPWSFNFRRPLSAPPPHLGNLPGQVRSLILAENDGDLLLLGQVLAFKFGFYVWRWVTDRREWKRTESLRGRALFVAATLSSREFGECDGLRFVASVEPGEGRQFRRDCIYLLCRRDSDKPAAVLPNHLPGNTIFEYSLQDAEWRRLPVWELVAGKPSVIPQAWMFPSLC